MYIPKFVYNSKTGYEAKLYIYVSGTMQDSL